MSLLTTESMANVGFLLVLLDLVVARVNGLGLAIVLSVSEVVVVCESRREGVCGGTLVSSVVVLPLPLPLGSAAAMVEATLLNRFSKLFQKSKARVCAVRM